MINLDRFQPPPDRDLIDPDMAEELEWKKGDHEYDLEKSEEPKERNATES